MSDLSVRQGKQESMAQTWKIIPDQKKHENQAGYCFSTEYFVSNTLGIILQSSGNFSMTSINLKRF